MISKVIHAAVIEYIVTTQISSQTFLYQIISWLTVSLGIILNSLEDLLTNIMDQHTLMKLISCIYRLISFLSKSQLIKPTCIVKVQLLFTTLTFKFISKAILNVTVEL